MNNDVAIVVPSCDKYSDLWDPFFQNLRSKWPDNPYNIYLISNNADFKFPNVSVVKVGNDVTWSANLKGALNKISERNIFLLIDDLFFENTVDSKAVFKLFTRFNKEKMNYLRFNPTPGPSGKVDNDGLGLIPKKDCYRTSTVVSLWNKKVLIDVLDEKESAWDFELVGSERTEKYEGWYASRRWLLPTTNLVIKGKYDPVAYRKLTEEGILLSDKRPKMTIFEYTFFQLIKLRSSLFTLIPRKVRRPIRKMFLKKV